ncbi:MAG: ABC transporter permease, partial [Bacillota bacterium]
MINYIIKRLLALIPILIGVAVIVFLIVHLIPGDPAQTMLGERATDQALERLREQMGLNDPLPVQFGSYVKDLLRGDLGRSIMSNNPVSNELSKRFPATLELSFFAIMFAVGIGVPAGIFAAVNQNSWFDNLSMLIALMGVSMPIFWLGLMFIWLFAVELGWFPPSSRIGTGLDFSPITNLYVLDSILQLNFSALKDVLHHLVLP